MKKGMILLSLALFTGRISAQQIESSALIFIGPGDNLNLNDDIGCGMSFGFVTVADNVHGTRSGQIQLKGPNLIGVWTFNGSADESTGKGTKQEFRKTVNRNQSTCTLTLVPNGAPERYKKGGLVNIWPEPEFLPISVLKETPQFLYEVSYTSEFKKEAVLANFDRLTDKNCSHHYIQNHLGEIDSSYGDGVYCITINNKPRRAHLECVTYHDGSKCTVTTRLEYVQVGDKFDAIQDAKYVRSEIIKIFKD
ncbi:hypothetical protein [Solilutibacter silvestris]|uniref:Uncharacterized protein n=1 Tax=Solilutibacter silvestris TaxID=1645665 RepID=A0A2K1Q1F4_9GAMM|nr:hypothetical protein [Lysobacter silvestris]PNS08866.1 hypothetical protein Lysil_0495 [Lysobacter silvestris]